MEQWNSLLKLVGQLIYLYKTQGPAIKKIDYYLYFICWQIHHITHNLLQNRLVYNYDNKIIEVYLELVHFTELMWRLTLFFKNQFFNINRTLCWLIRCTIPMTNHPIRFVNINFIKFIAENADSQKYVLPNNGKIPREYFRNWENCSFERSLQNPLENKYSFER